MRWIYNLFIGGMTTAIRLGSSSTPKLKRMLQGRETVFPVVEAFRKSHPSPLLWIHVASLGEYEQAKPVIRTFKSHYPFWAVAVSFFSPSGYDNVIKKKQEFVDFITYLPFDTPQKAKKFVATLSPNVAIFVKYDLWANHIREVGKENIPLYLVAASFRNEQVYFKFYGGFFRNVLRSFDHIFTQNEYSVELLKKIDCEQCSVAGDPRFDNVAAISRQPRYFPEIEVQIKQPVMVLGSVWQEDMDILIPFINAAENIQFIIAPHDIHSPAMDRWRAAIKKTSLKYSEMQDELPNQAWEVLFIDNIGMLSSLYQFAQWAYVGGAFGKGLHNILEPLAFGIPVIFGKLKKVSKFPEAAISESYGCGFPVDSLASLGRTMGKLHEKEAYQKACRAAKKLLEDNQGSAEKIVSEIKKQLEWRKVG
ncbi:3-deoxy-D-manno-octulosonic acid transferase [Negadavirga shengliensis]|uniref:3-deoxy-D-manno-octulosonic acid transferase n=1 Tax=Negadavirga shengliensis TaxID=1389218 RepID=A0ABV9T5T4_9BACT